MLKRLALALSILALTPVSADATGLMTLGDLQQICTAADEPNQNACQFFIFGVALGADTAAAQLGDHTHYCLPDNTSEAAITFMVKKAIGEDLMFFPKDRELPAVSFVMAAVMKSFPCGKK